MYSDERDQMQTLDVADTTVSDTVISDTDDDVLFYRMINVLNIECPTANNHTKKQACKVFFDWDTDLDVEGLDIGPDVQDQTESVEVPHDCIYELYGSAVADPLGDFMEVLHGCIYVLRKAGFERKSELMLTRPHMTYHMMMPPQIGSFAHITDLPVRDESPPVDEWLPKNHPLCKQKTVPKRQKRRKQRRRQRKN